MNISIFNGVQATTPVNSTLEAVMRAITTDENTRKLTDDYRRTGIKYYKARSVLFAVACVMDGGKALCNVRSLTTLSLVDIDHVAGGPAAMAEIKARAAADPHTLMCYTTISGQGLRIIFRYTLPDSLAGQATAYDGGQDGQAARFYTMAFGVGNDYYERLLGVKTDRKCKNLTRLSGLAHDPGAYLNTDATPFTADEIQRSHAHTLATQQLASRLVRLQRYHDTVMKPRLEAEGIVFRSGQHNEYVMRVGYMLAERRYSLALALRWANVQFADYADTEQVIRSCYRTAKPGGGSGNGGEGQDGQAAGRTAGGKYASVAEIKEFLDSSIRLRYNEITTRVECLATDAASDDEWEPITDRVLNSLWARMADTRRVMRQDIINVVGSDYVPHFNPFKSYLDSLPAWHEGDHDHLADLAATIRLRQPSIGGTDSTGQPTPMERFFATALKKWMVAMVAGWIDSKAVNNLILVLIGRQGSYKTTWFNYLLPPQLSRYFYTKTNAGRMTKDDLLTLAQYGLVCCEELDTMRPAELAQLKAAVTMPSIDERAAYAHYHEHRKHIASFCATGNNPMFLTDPTGNRRWLPFEVESILSPRAHRHCYEGIYAQALALYRSGFEYWFSDNDNTLLTAHNQQFETPNIEREAVAQYFRKPGQDESGEFITASRAVQIIGGAIGTRLNVVRVGMAFADLGFERVRYRGVRGYLAIVRSADDIQAYQKGIALSGDRDDT